MNARSQARALDLARLLYNKAQRDGEEVETLAELVLLLSGEAQNVGAPIQEPTGKRFLVALRPWVASGPGWANAGLTIIWGWPDGSREEQTVYREDLRGDTAALFPFLSAMYGTVANEVMAGRAWEAREERERG